MRVYHAISRSVDHKVSFVGCDENITCDHAQVDVIATFSDGVFTTLCPALYDECPDNFRMTSGYTESQLNVLKQWMTAVSIVITH